VLLDGELEHEIRREAVAVAADLLIETLRADPVELGELGIEQHSLAAQDEDGACDLLDGQGCRACWCRRSHASIPSLIVAA
jgi:hypothetical protein